MVMFFLLFFGFLDETKALTNEELFHVPHSIELVLWNPVLQEQVYDPSVFSQSSLAEQS